MASAIKRDQIAVGWQAFGKSPRRYFVTRDFQVVGVLPAGKLQFVDAGLESRRSYSYTVIAENSDNTYTPSVSVSAQPITGPLLTQTTFEQDSDSLPVQQIGGWERIINNGHSITVTTERARAGRKSVKFDFDFADWSSAPPISINTQKAMHCMLTQWHARDVDNAVLGRDFWVGVSIYIENWEPDSAENGELIWQFHGASEAPASSGSPPLALYVHGNDVQVKLTADSAGVYGKTQARISPRAVGISPRYDLSDLVGRWTDWVIRVNFDYTAGLVQIWKDGTQVVDYNGPTLYRSDNEKRVTGPYFNFGIYKWGWGSNPTRVTKRVLYVDEVRLAGDGGSVEDVKPRR